MSAAEVPVLYGQSWVEGGELLLTFVLFALIGLERQLRGKSAGLRLVTGLHFVIVFGFTGLSRRLAGCTDSAVQVDVAYLDGRPCSDSCCTR